MKPEEIKVGRTYRNKGSGRTRRKVVSIGDRTPEHWFSSGPRPDEPGVHFEDNRGRRETTYLKSFAAWCGGEGDEFPCYSDTAWTDSTCMGALCAKVHDGVLSIVPTDRREPLVKMSAEVADRLAEFIFEWRRERRTENGEWSGAISK